MTSWNKHVIIITKTDIEIRFQEDIMTKFIKKRLFQGFICLHILHHAGIEAVYGNWLIEELAEHGYKLSPGTLYPILHSLEKEKLLKSYEETVEGKVRKYYLITELGKAEFSESKEYLMELVGEIGLKGDEKR